MRLLCFFIVEIIHYHRAVRSRTIIETQLHGTPKTLTYFAGKRKRLKKPQLGIPCMSHINVINDKMQLRVHNAVAAE
jgi:hypothetical protein